MNMLGWGYPMNGLLGAPCGATLCETFYLLRLLPDEALDVAYLCDPIMQPDAFGIED